MTGSAAARSLAARALHALMPAALKAAQRAIEEDSMPPSRRAPSQRLRVQRGAWGASERAASLTLASEAQQYYHSVPLSPRLLLHTPLSNAALFNGISRGVSVWGHSQGSLGIYGSSASVCCPCILSATRIVKSVHAGLTNQGGRKMPWSNGRGVNSGRQARANPRARPRPPRAPPLAIVTN